MRAMKKSAKKESKYIQIKTDSDVDPCQMRVTRVEEVDAPSADAVVVAGSAGRAGRRRARLRCRG